MEEPGGHRHGAGMGGHQRRAAGAGADATGHHPFRPFVRVPHRLDEGETVPQGLDDRHHHSDLVQQGHGGECFPHTDIGFVAGGDGDTQSLAPCHGEVVEIAAGPAALGDDGHRSRPDLRGRTIQTGEKTGRHPPGRGDDATAVRLQNPRSGGGSRRGESFLERDSLSARLGEAGGEHDDSTRSGALRHDVDGAGAGTAATTRSGLCGRSARDRYNSTPRGEGDED